ncbi:hypothetical protein B0H14DRAFT_3453445 [Mycena olivaceomarginata]|nr:hypothetical protein B0H14DRAFT_3453445 [Mycena olivaceomarginata]
MSGASKKKKKAPGDVPRPRSRPPIQFVARGKVKAKSALTRLLGSKSPPRALDSPGPESAIGSGVALSGEEARTTQLAGEEYGVPSERDDPREKPIWLQHVNRERDEWELVDTINTEL